MEKRGFSDYFTSTITETLEKDPQRDVTTIEVDLKLSTLKPIHAKLLMSIYEFLQGEKGRKIILNGWKAAGITEAVESARKGRIPTLDPFILSILCFLPEIKSKFCCWTLLFSNEMSAKNIKFTS